LNFDHADLFGARRTVAAFPNSYELLPDLAPVCAHIAHIRSAIPRVPSYLAPISANVAGVAREVAAIRTQLLLRGAVFFIGSIVANVGSSLSFIATKIAPVVVNVARVAPNISPIGTQVVTLRSRARDDRAACDRYDKHQTT
jgi:hypothetical protein